MRLPVAIAAVLALALTPAAAEASQIDHVLRDAKAGAKQVAPDTVAWPRDGVSVTMTTARKAGASGLRECKRGYACLWMHFNYRGWVARFYHYGTYRLSDYGLGRFDERGASSYYNHQTGGAKAILHATYDVSLNGYGNLYGALDERGKSITLRP